MMEDHQFGDDGGGAGSDIDDDADSDVGQEDGERRSSFDIHDMKSSGLNLSKELLASEYGLESNSDSSDDKDEPSLSTIEAANAAKASIIKYYNNLFSSIYEREQRRLRYEQKMDQIGLEDKEKEERRKKLDLIETQFLRARRIKLRKDTFQTISVIGRGSFGEVRLVQMKGTKKLFAMKKLKKVKMIARNQVEHVKKERDDLADLNDFYKQNAWVVRLYYSFQDALHLYLIMEYVPGGDLMTQLMKYEKFSEKVAKFYLAEIVLAVASIHKFNYLHRDIKTDNILLDKKGHIKLSDFGLCTAITTEDKVREMQHKYATLKRNTSFTDVEAANAAEQGSASSHELLAPPSVRSISRSGSAASLTETDKDGSLSSSARFHSWKKKRRELAFSEVGTPDYMAPEVLDPDGNGYGKECDWWSVGVILFEMLAGFPAFYSSSESGSSATYRKILNWKETLEQVLGEITISADARDLICRFLTERENRIGTRGGLEEIQRHPFFAGIDWDSIRNKQAPIIPHIEHATDTSNFPIEDEDEVEISEEEEEEKELERSYPLYRGRRLRQTDIPFIGFTYKNLAAVPQLIRSPAKGPTRSQSSHE